MSDAHPENEVGDVERPTDAVVETPDADALGEQIADHRAEVQKRGERKRETDPPRSSRPRFHGPRDVLGDVVKRRSAVDPLRRRQARRAGLAYRNRLRRKSDELHGALTLPEDGGPFSGS